MGERVLYNGVIYTLAPSQPNVQALLIRAGRIAAIGDSAEIRALAGLQAQTYDLAGRCVLPGFQDAHVHFTELGLALAAVSLEGALSLQEALDRVRQRAQALPPGEWLQGRGWDHNLWPGAERPTRQDLDRAAPHVPVCLASKDGHSLWVNTLALHRAEIDRNTPDPPGGQILRDEHGDPTGILTENAQMLIARVLPQPSAKALDAAIRRALAEAARLGVTSIHNCEGMDRFAALERLEAAGDLTLRVWHMLPREALEAALGLGLRTGFGSEWLKIGHLKLFADGALGSATAEMLEPYEGRPGDYGVAAMTTEEIYDAVRRAAQGGIASAIHAIGDAANRRVLDVYERVAQELGPLGLRQRIEHAQLVSPEDMPRFARLGVIASMQPIHATQDMEMAERKWGARCRWGYAWRSLLRQGARLALGTDCPVESLDPLRNLYAAVTRRRANGTPPGGWFPEECLTL
ncbi:MAG: amidohydrolase, partial [Chloroflexi bacterium]|nr:amidohydrolase [Chloroflexota bacterium]